MQLVHLQMSCTGKAGIGEMHIVKTESNLSREQEKSTASFHTVIWRKYQEQEIYTREYFNFF